MRSPPPPHGPGCPASSYLHSRPEDGPIRSGSLQPDKHSPISNKLKVSVTYVWLVFYHFCSVETAVNGSFLKTSHVLSYFKYPTGFAKFPLSTIKSKTNVLLFCIQVKSIAGLTQVFSSNNLFTLKLQKSGHFKTQ